MTTVYAQHTIRYTIYLCCIEGFSQCGGCIDVDLSQHGADRLQFKDVDEPVSSYHHCNLHVKLPWLIPWPSLIISQSQVGRTIKLHQNGSVAIRRERNLYKVTFFSYTESVRE